MANISLPTINLQLSGPVAQTFFPWTNYFTVNVGQSSDPAIEQQALSVASYGKQLGRIGDALIVLLNHIQLTDLTPAETDAICDLKCMLRDIARVKEKHNAKHVLRPNNPPPTLPAPTP